jgi:hypothetical protein
MPIILLAVPEWSDAPTNQVEQAWQELQAERARQFGGRLVVAWESGHDIHLEKPGIVIDAIHEVAEAVHQPNSGATPAA